LLQLPEGANHQAGTDHEDHCEGNLRDHKAFAERLSPASNCALPGAANPVGQIAFTHLDQWYETEEKDSNDRNRDGKREHGKTNANLFGARHAVGRKQQQSLQPREGERDTQS
jgi:hypothetical protein